MLCIFEHAQKCSSSISDMNKMNYKSNLARSKKILNTSLYAIEECLRLYKSHNLSLESRLSISQITNLLETGQLPKKPGKGESLYSLRKIISNQIAGYEANNDERFPDEILEKYGWRISELEEIVEKRLKILKLKQPAKKEKYKSRAPEDILIQYLHEAGQYHILKKEELNDLITKAQKGDQKAREKAIKANLRLVISVAKRYRYNGADIMDLIQMGNQGLIAAIDKFDPERASFSTCACWWIRQAITRELLNLHRIIRIPIGAINDINKLKKIDNKYLAEKARLPTIDEVCKQTHFKEQKIEFLRTITKNRPISIDGMDEKLNLTSKRFDDDRKYKEEIEELDLLIQACEKILLPREWLIITLRFGLHGYSHHTLEQIGKKIGVTRERVRQVQEKGIKRIRRKLFGIKKA